MTENVRPYPQQDPDPRDQPSTTDAARDEAATVGRSAGEAGSRVAQTAADQAKEVVSETARQARDLLGEASGHARNQASDQQHRAAHQLHSVAGELREMAAKGGQSGVATEVAQQAAERIDGAASWLEQREPADLLRAVRDFARRRPAVFLAGAAAAGLAAGRLTRGMTDAARSGGQGQGQGMYGMQGMQGMQRRPHEIPSGAAIPPPPDPDMTSPMPGYPADAVPGAGTGTVTPGAVGTEPYYPAGGVPGPGAASAADEIVPGSFHGHGGTERSPYEEGGFPESAPETYRPGQQP